MFLDELRTLLKNGQFQPQPVRERKIPKPGGSGKVRRLGIPRPYQTNPGNPSPLLRPHYRASAWWAGCWPRSPYRPCCSPTRRTRRYEPAADRSKAPSRATPASRFRRVRSSRPRRRPAVGDHCALAEIKSPTPAAETSPPARSAGSRCVRVPASCVRRAQPGSAAEPALPPRGGELLLLSGKVG